MLWRTATEANRHTPRWLMYFFDKFQNGRIILKNDFQKYKKIDIDILFPSFSKLVPGPQIFGTVPRFLFLVTGFFYF
jgi:hypothetical protein